MKTSFSFSLSLSLVSPAAIYWPGAPPSSRPCIQTPSARRKRLHLNWKGQQKRQKQKRRVPSSSLQRRTRAALPRRACEGPFSIPPPCGTSRRARPWIWSRRPRSWGARGTRRGSGAAAAEEATKKKKKRRKRRRSFRRRPQLGLGHPRRLPLLLPGPVPDLVKRKLVVLLGLGEVVGGRRRV